MPIGIVGSMFTVFHNKEGEASVDMTVLFPVIALKHLELESSNHKFPLVYYPLLRQPFLKQLYTLRRFSICREENAKKRCSFLSLKRE